MQETRLKGLHVLTIFIIIKEFNHATMGEYYLQFRKVPQTLPY